MSTFDQWISEFLGPFNHYFASVLQDDEYPPALGEAMRYSALAGGKRIRPLLVHASGSLMGAAPETIYAAASAVEMVHCYSLIHDDLPAMDDDDLRRGRPTLHKQYNEATAILAGDALLTDAFSLLTSPRCNWPSTEHALRAVRTLARASGGVGMVAGQMLDIQAEGTHPDQQSVERMFLLKTGALIRASVQLGACSAASASTDDWQRLTKYGNAIGQAFQIQDDILDVTVSSEQLGKPQGSDAARDKPNYALRFGIKPAQDRIQQLYQTALSSIEVYGAEAEPLYHLARYIIHRQK
ncbi:MAG: (2E,6E)-farnesyl diphosphate synthase [Wenzhouxiangellaceae bacterium]